MSNFIAPGLFILSWFAYGWLVERSPWRNRTLSHYMERERRSWIETMASRDLRMIDTSIMLGLQNGTGFFASTSLLAIGAAFTLLNSTERFLALSDHLPFMMATSASWFELKAIGLLLIYAYAFLKFGWSYRLFNYTSILIGAVPMNNSDATPEERRHAIEKCVGMNLAASREFTRGQRAFFLAIGYLGWFLGDVLFIVSSVVIYTMMATRQFASPARTALMAPPLPRAPAGSSQQSPEKTG